VLSGRVTGTVAAADSPVRLEGDTVTASHLTIEAGTLVCAAPGTVLFTPDTLSVNGTEEAPVLLFAADSTAPWGGIRGRVVRSTGASIAETSTVRMSHTQLARARIGVAGGDMTLTDVWIRNTDLQGIEGFGRMTDLRAEDTCLAGPDYCGALITTYAGRGRSTPLELEGAVLRRSGGWGLVVSNGSVATLADVHVEDASEWGLRVATASPPYRDGSVTLSGPLTITHPGGGSGHDVLDVPGSLLGPLLSALGPRLERGDRVRSVGHVFDPLVIPEGVILFVEMGWNGMPSFGSVALGAGSELRGTFAFFRDLEAVGASGDPARLAFSGFASVDPGAAVLTEAAVDGGELIIRSRGATLDRVVARRATLRVSGPSASLKNTVVVLSPGTAVEIAADSVVLERCDVSSNAGVGIHVLRGAAVRVGGCDLEDNRGAGLANDGADTVMAEGNWWGAPEGPEGPHGDGVRGAVAHGAPLVTRAGSTAVSVSVRASATVAAVGDTVRILVWGMDAAGNPVPPTHFDLSASGEILSFPHPGDPFLAVAKAPGVVRVDAVYRHEPAVRDAVEILVKAVSSESPAQPQGVDRNEPG
jgi:hypothetical protein